MRWAFLIITLLFLLLKSRFSYCKSYNLLSEGARKKEVQVILKANAQDYLIQYISFENRS